MDMMLLGETIQTSPQDPPDLDYYGFWMPASGNEGVAAVETFLLSAVDVLTVTLETKSSDTDDSAATSIGSVLLSSTSPQLWRFGVNDAKDLVRYRVTVDAAGGPAFAHLQFSQPLWSPN